MLKHESRLRIITKEFKAILDASSYTVILLSPDQEILWKNQNAALKIDSKASDFPGQNCYLLLHHFNSPCDGCPAIKSFRTGIAESSRIKAHDSRSRYVFSFPVKEGAGVIRNVIAIACNITDNYPVSADYAPLSCELSVISDHGINNPINCIGNYAQILLDEYDRICRNSAITGQIKKEQEYIVSIIRGLLADAETTRKEMRPVFINELLADSLKLSTGPIHREGINLITDFSPDPLEIIARPEEIILVCLNIISNARYALNKINLKTYKLLVILWKKIIVEDCPYIQIIFYDRGIGIPIDKLDKVINPFFTTKPGGSGTGLGLSICDRIIRKHNGKLKIESIEGEFTKVTVLLPVREKKGVDDYQKC